MPIDEKAQSLQNGFRSFLQLQGKDKVESNLISSDAFFLLNNSIPGLDFYSWLNKDVEDIKEYYSEELFRYFSYTMDEASAKTKAKEYLFAFLLLKSYYDAQSITFDSNTEECSNKENWVVNYCESMRMNYSYKPLLIIAMIELMSANGICNLDEIALFFIEYYRKRRISGLVVEKRNSYFANSKADIEDAKNHILSNPVFALEKASVIYLSSDKNHVCFTQSALKCILPQKETLLQICKNLLRDYFDRLKTDNSNETGQINAETLGIILKGMYENAERGDSVTMIQLFGIRYADSILKNDVSVGDIIHYSGIKPSYYAEVQKGIRLSKYVKEKQDN